MIDKKELVDPSNLDAAPVVEEDRTGPDNALKYPPELDSDARDDVGLQDKLQSPAEQDPNWMEGLTPEVRMRVQCLQEIQGLQNKLEKKLLQKRQALEDKYEDSFKLLYNKRSKIVNGEVDVESNTYETAEEATSDEKATIVKGIPYFWLTAMKNNEMLALMITSRDEEALKYLKDIKYCTIGRPLNLKLDFFFDTNPFFTNSILTRTYKDFENHEEITDAQSTGTEINWFPKKSLTHEIKKYEQIGRSKRKTRTEECDSFFNFFGDSEEGIGSILYNEIIPKAVSWYTGEALLDETETESSEEEEEEEEFDEDEDENESDGEASKKRTRVEDLTARK